MRARKFRVEGLVDGLGLTIWLELRVAGLVEGFWISSWGFQLKAAVPRPSLGLCEPFQNLSNL